jgi:hypothetical protein
MQLWIGHDKDVIVCAINIYRILVRQPIRVRQFVKLIRRK